MIIFIRNLEYDEGLNLIMLKVLVYNFQSGKYQSGADRFVTKSLHFGFDICSLRRMTYPAEQVFYNV